VALQADGAMNETHWLMLRYFVCGLCCGVAIDAVVVWLTR
jgi:hypothetical protein